MAAAQQWSDIHDVDQLLKKLFGLFENDFLIDTLTEFDEECKEEERKGSVKYDSAKVVCICKHCLVLSGDTPVWACVKCSQQSTAKRIISRK
jgi:hypothetical protein